MFILNVKKSEKIDRTSFADAELVSGVITTNLITLHDNFQIFGNGNLNILSSGNLNISGVPIPDGITSLYLRLDPTATGAELALALAEIKSIETLSLKYNKLDTKSDVELAQILAAPSQSIKTLILQYNALGTIDGVKLAQALAALSESIKTIDLGFNDLGERTCEELQEILTAPPGSLTTIGLSGSSLWKKTGAELAQVIAALKQSIKTLDLSDNALGEKTCEELKQILAAAPKSLTTIDLSGNGLGNKTCEELKQILAAIPKSLTTIDLSGNGLASKNDTELAELFMPLLQPEILKQIIIEPEVYARLNKIFAATSLSPTSSIFSTSLPQDQSLINRIYRIYSSIFSQTPTTITTNPISSMQQSKDLLFIEILKAAVTPADTASLPLSEQLSKSLFIEMLTENENLKLIFLVNYLFKEIAMRVDADNSLAPEKRLRSSNALFEFTPELYLDDPELKNQYIPALKVLNDILIKVLDSQRPMPDLCELILEQNLMPVNYLIYTFPPKYLNELIFQLRTHEPIRALPMVEELSLHIYSINRAENLPLMQNDSEFRKRLLNHFAWLKTQSVTKIDVDEIDDVMKDLRALNPSQKWARPKQ